MVVIRFFILVDLLFIYIWTVSIDYLNKQIRILTLFKQNQQQNTTGFIKNVILLAELEQNLPENKKIAMVNTLMMMGWER